MNCLYSPLIPREYRHAPVSQFKAKTGVSGTMSVHAGNGLAGVQTVREGHQSETPSVMALGRMIHRVAFLRRRRVIRYGHDTESIGKVNADLRLSRTMPTPRERRVPTRTPRAPQRICQQYHLSDYAHKQILGISPECYGIR